MYTFAAICFYFLLFIYLFLVGCAEWTPRVGFHRLDLRLPIPIHVTFYAAEDFLCGPPLRVLLRRFDVQEIVNICCLETTSSYKLKRSIVAILNVRCFLTSKREEEVGGEIVGEDGAGLER